MRQSCLTLCDPIDGSPPGSPVPGILQARTRVGCHFLLQCRKVKSESEVTQSCWTLCDPMDCSSPGSSVHGIFQARVLEWGAIAFSITNITAMLFVFHLFNKIAVSYTAKCVLRPLIKYYIVPCEIDDGNSVTLDMGRRNKRECFPGPRA